MPKAIRVHYSELDPKTGQRKKWTSAVWYASYLDARTGKWRKKKGYVDKRATEQLAARLERESAQAQEGIRKADSQILTPLIEEYETALKARGSSFRHLQATIQDIRDTCEECGWRLISDINDTDLEKHLSGLTINRQVDGRMTPTPIANRTWNRKVWSLRSFMSFLIKRDLLVRDPLMNVAKRKEESDKKRLRRHISESDFSKLIKVTKARDDYYFRGPDRAMLYIVAAYTGLRASELRSLTPSSFRLNEKPPMVVCKGSYSKRRREDTIPIQTKLAEMLQEYLKGRPEDQPIWPGRWTDNAADVLAKDLESAGIPYQDSQGAYFDFHALRVQFVSTLALSGVSPMVVRELARHSSIELTTKVYTKLGLDTRAEGVNSMPEPPTQ